MTPNTQMTWTEANVQRQRNARALNSFLPRTLEERRAKLADRMGQAWPTFGRNGLYDLVYNPLLITAHDTGTVVRFFDSGTTPTFDSVGAVKHGAYWYLSEPRDGLERFTNKQMQAYLQVNKLNWVVLE